jgi:hypothetical protein
VDAVNGEAITVIVPVLNRPENTAPLLRSLEATTDRARVIFVCTPGDDAQIAAVEETWADHIIVPWERGPGDYARKINLAYSLAEEPLALLGADDLRFHGDWFTEIEETIAQNPLAGVIGTNDMGNPSVKAGKHSTHPVVTRAYIDEQGGVIGEPGVVYCTEYDHQWCDVELVQTAQARGVYAHAFDAKVEHLHPLWRKSEMTATHRKALAASQADGALFRGRKHLWEREQVKT